VGAGGGGAAERVLLLAWLPTRARGRYVFSATACGVAGHLGLLLLAALLPGGANDWRVMFAAAAAANAAPLYWAWVSAPCPPTPLVWRS
jgi:hypothetical protein